MHARGRAEFADDSRAAHAHDVLADRRRRRRHDPVRFVGRAAIHIQAGQGADFDAWDPGQDHSRDEPGVVRACYPRRRTRRLAVGPKDLDVIELHDASAFAELEIYEELGSVQAGRKRQTNRRRRRPRSPAGFRSIPRAGCSPRAIRWAQPASRRSVKFSGNCAARPASVRSSNAKIGMTQNGGGMVRNEAAALGDPHFRRLTA